MTRIPSRPPGWRALAALRGTFSSPWLAIERPLPWAGASLVLVGCSDLLAQEDCEPSLARQQEQGWNVGDETMPILLPGATDTDSEGGHGWQRRLWGLSDLLAPRSSRWSPYYAPTLFQSVQASRSDSLRAVLRPILTPTMQEAYRQGLGLAAHFAGARGCRTDVAVVLDADGPESVAAAAGMSVCLEPVFFFDNWPHPAGVVPSHLTLAAVLYYAPVFERLQASRPTSLAPLFVLDRRRLSPYVDDAKVFDNRYVARLPSAGAMAAAGIRRLLYVTGSVRTPREQDDLNEDFVVFARSGIDVRMVALSAFIPAHVEEEQNGESSPMPGEEAANSLATDSSPRVFAGSTTLSKLFWSWYGWPDQNGQLSPFPAPEEAGPIPPPLLGAWTYRPVERPTMFSTEGADECAPAWPLVTPSGQFGGYAGGRSGTMGRIGGSFGFG